MEHGVLKKICSFAFWIDFNSKQTGLFPLSAENNFSYFPSGIPFIKIFRIVSFSHKTVTVTTETVQNLLLVKWCGF